MNDTKRWWDQPAVWLSLYFLVFLFLLVRMPLPVYYEVVLDVRRFFPGVVEGLLFVALVSAAFWAYWRLLRLVERDEWRPTLATLLVFAAGPLGVAALMYPFNANDLYRYLLRGQITAFLNGNPFSQPISDFPATPLTPLAGEWVDYTSPYGPLWELLAPLPLLVVPDWPLGQLLGLKLLTGAGFLLTGCVIFAARGKNKVAAAAWLLNPALLLIFAADGHNDAVMLLFLVAGWVVVQRGVSRHAWEWAAAGGLVLWLAVMIKAIALLPLPLMAIHVWRSFPAWRDRLKIGVVTLSGAVGLVWLLFLPFGSPLDLLSRLIDEASAGSSFSPITLAILLQQRSGQATVPLWRTLSLGGTLIGALWVVWRVWRGRSPLQGTADLFMIYLVLAFNFRLWYTAWPFPFLLLDPHTSRLRLTAGHLFLLFGQLSVFIFGHLWAGPFERSLLVAYLVGIPFVFVGPIAGAYLRSTIYEARRTKDD